MNRIFAPAFLSLLLLVLTLRSLNFSQSHLIPTFDEPGYLDFARETEKTGVIATVTSYVQGTNDYAVRNPLYMMLIAPLMRHTPGDFPRAKMAGLVQMWTLILVVFFLCRRLWGEPVALGAAALTALSPFSALISQQVLADILFTLFFFASVLVLLDQRRPLFSWTLAGALAGLAFLTKDSGYLLLLAPLALTCYDHRASFWKRPHLYLYIAGFIVTASFLLMRNLRVAGTLLHNDINKVTWLDDWRQYFLFSYQPIWADIGPAWYWSTHSLVDIAARLFNGFGDALVLVIMAMGVGFESKLWLFPAGFVLLLTALYGLYWTWNGPDRRIALCAATMLSIMMLGLAWITPATNPNVRYAYPIAVLLYPFAAAGLLRAGRHLFLRIDVSWIKTGAVAALVLAAIAVAFSARWPLNPWDDWTVPPFWAGTSSWIRTHIGDEPFLISHISPYSPWDTGRDTRRAFPYGLPTEVLRDRMNAGGIRFALLDQSVVGDDPYPQKYGPSDQHGPKTFLNLPRCYADALTPSVFLIYGESCD